MSEFIIELKQLEFYSFHGIYEEEKKAGGIFVVDISVKVDSGKNKIKNISETVNYASLYEIIKEEMNHPRELLEMIAQSTAEKMHLIFPQIKELQICIEKKNPPIMGFSGDVAVVFKERY